MIQAIRVLRIRMETSGTLMGIKSVSRMVKDIRSHSKEINEDVDSIIIIMIY